MEILSSSPLAAQLMLVCILLPFVCGTLGWACGLYGAAQKDRILQAVERFLLYATPTAVLLVLLYLYHCIGAYFVLPELCGLGLSFTLDGLRFVLCMLAAVCWLAAAIFTPHALAGTANKSRFILFMLLTEGATLGVFLSADLYTTLIFFEIMSITSWVLVAHTQTTETMRAADSYLAFAVLGGLSTLMGLFLLSDTLGTLTISELGELAALVSDKTPLYVAGALILVGFAAKAGMFPLHTWMPLAYPAAPTPATALLSAILSKAGLFGILVLSTQLFRFDAAFGTAMLLFGTITMLTGAVLGVFSTELKRTLACSSMSQIGFILVGVGMLGILGEEGALAISGLLLHLCNHTLFKLCLFLCASVIVHTLGTGKLDEIRGFGRGKPLLAYTFGMAALGIMGVPLWSGYISKTLLHEAIVEGIAHMAAHGHSTLLLQGVEVLFLFSGGLTVVYMLKLFVCIFIEKNADSAKQARFETQNRHYAAPALCIVLAIIGSVSLPLGLSAHVSMESLAAFMNSLVETATPAHSVSYFSLEALEGAAISLSIGLVLYFFVVRKVFIKNGVYQGLLPACIDLEARVYRPVLLQFLPFVGAVGARFVSSLFEWARRGAHAILFANDNDGIVTPAEDFHFTVYEQDPKGVRGFIGSLSFSLLLFGFGMTFILLYLVGR